MTTPLPPTDSPAGIADDQIEELIRLHEAATPGPWTVLEKYFGYDDDPCVLCINEINREMHNPEWADAIDWPRDVINTAFIVAMRNAINPLIQRLKRAEAERDQANIHERRMATNRNYYCERINQIAATLGMAGKDNFSPDAILRKAASVIEERDRLREALEPFAEEYRIRRMADSGVDQYALIDMAYANAPGILGSVRAALNNEHFRDAAAALADAGKGGGE